MLMWNLPLARRQDFHPQLTEALYSCEELIPLLGCTHTGRRARHDEIARFQGVVLRKKCDLLGHAPDHLVDVRVLAKLAVRSEERRVGKECRSRWSRYDNKNRRCRACGHARQSAW